MTEIITTKNSPLKHDNRGVDYYLVLNASLADKNMFLTKKIENTEESLMVSSQTIETLRSCVQNMDNIIVENSRHRLWLEEQIESIRISFLYKSNYFDNRKSKTIPQKSKAHKERFEKYNKVRDHSNHSNQCRARFHST